ncbi:porin family protein [Pontibacter pamirensis]|uniref:porin family protein n=1 Tax=Pontibacter pamirensis TaxID=2562824 RepID=UPI00138986D1|nr:porin family protein [Pontibacter pamirensis]
MKKIMLLFVLALAATTGYTQSLGVKAGATYTTFTGNDTRDYDYRVGYTAGLMLQRHITDLIGVQLEALYTAKGAKTSSQSGSNEVEESFRLNYVDVPVLFHVSAGGLFFDLGPQASFIAKASQVREVISGSTTTSSKTDITDHPYTIDFGYAAGIGYRADNGLGLELRYNGGLKKVDDEGPFAGRERRNAGFGLMLSYFVGR